MKTGTEVLNPGACLFLLLSYQKNQTAIARRSASVSVEYMLRVYLGSY